MRTNWTRCFKETLKHEGGYVNHPKDPGGATNFGVTQKVYDSYRKINNKNPQTVRNITQAEVSEIYRKNYWNVVAGDYLPFGLDYVAYDAGVNSGPRRGVQWLQKALGVSADGEAGPVTIEAAKNAKDKKAVIRKACETRMGFLRSLRTFSTFGRGWTRRVIGVEALAIKMHLENEVKTIEVEKLVKSASLTDVATKKKIKEKTEETIKADASEQSKKAEKNVKMDTAKIGGTAVGAGGAGSQAASDDNIANTLLSNAPDVANTFLGLHTMDWVFVAVTATCVIFVAYFLWKRHIEKTRVSVYREIEEIT